MNSSRASLTARHAAGPRPQTGSSPRPSRRWRDQGSTLWIMSRAAGDSWAAMAGGSLASEASMFRSRCTWLLPLKGGRPVMSSNRMVPTLHRSALASYFWKLRISGAMYRGEPHSVSARPWGCRGRAKPKSAIFKTAPGAWEDSSRFWGLRSLCEPALAQLWRDGGGEQWGGALHGTVAAVCWLPHEDA